MHVFSESLSREKVESKRVDEHFSEEYHVLETPLELDKQGIDRILIHKESLEIRTIEYKHDWRASETGNAFIETCSVHKNGKCQKKGWLYTCRAEYLYYNVVENNKIYKIKTKDLQCLIDEKFKNYRTAAAKNPGYFSIGILVPLKELEPFVIMETIR